MTRASVRNIDDYFIDLLEKKLRQLHDSRTPIAHCQSSAQMIFLARTSRDKPYRVLSRTTFRFPRVCFCPNRPSVRGPLRPAVSAGDLSSACSPQSRKTTWCCRVDDAIESGGHEWTSIRTSSSVVPRRTEHHDGQDAALVVARIDGGYASGKIRSGRWLKRQYGEIERKIANRKCKFFQSNE